MPIWADLSNNDIPVELGKLLTGQGLWRRREAGASTPSRKLVDAKVKDAGLL